MTLGTSDPLTWRAGVPEGDDRSPHDVIVPRLWPFLLLSAVAGLWIDFGTLNRYHQSDSIVPILVSLQKWTPYYWEQNRFGMLVPLLASPLRNPWHNLLFQNAVTAFSGLATFFLIARYAIRNWTWPLVATAGAAGFLVLTPPDFRSFYLSTGQPYNVTLFLGLSGLLLADRYRLGRGPAWHVGLAALLILLSQWVNGAGFLIMAPLVMFRHLSAMLSGKPDAPDGGLPGPAVGPTSGIYLKIINYIINKQNIGIEVALLSAGMVFGVAAQKVAPYQTTWVVVPPASEWPSRFSAMGNDLRELLAPQAWPRLLAITSAIGLASLCVPLVRRRSGVAVTALLVTMAASLAYAAIMAILFPPRARYLLPALVIAETGLVSVALAPILCLFGIRARRVCLVAAAPCLLASVLISDGLPSPSRARAELDANLGSMTADLIGARCTHLAGDYWKVWTAVFHANMSIYERGGDGQVWGISHRSLPSRELWGWTDKGELRVAIPAGDDDQARHYLRLYGFPDLSASEKLASISVYECN